MMVTRNRTPDTMRRRLTSLKKSRRKFEPSAPIHSRYVSTIGTTIAIVAIRTIEIRWEISAPPTKSMVSRMGMNMMAVPKSGCLRMMSIGMKVRSAGTTSSRSLRDVPLA